MPLWTVRAVVAAVGGAQRADGLEAPLVGRERELRLVKELFHRAEESAQPALLIIDGDAGVGKSRLGWEFEKYVDGLTSTVRWHSGRCVGYGEGVAFFALAEAVRGRLQVLSAVSDEEEDLAALLERGLDQHAPDEDERDWLRPRLGAPSRGGHAVRGRGGRRRGHRGDPRAALPGRGGSRERGTRCSRAAGCGTTQPASSGRTRARAGQRPWGQQTGHGGGRALVARAQGSRRGVGRTSGGLFEAAAGLARTHHHPRTPARTLLNLAASAVPEDLARARAFGREAVQVSTSMGLAYWSSFARSNLMGYLWLGGEWDELDELLDSQELANDEIARRMPAAFGGLVAQARGATWAPPYDATRGDVVDDLMERYRYSFVAAMRAAGAGDPPALVVRRGLEAAELCFGVSGLWDDRTYLWPTVARMAIAARTTCLCAAPELVESSLRAAIVGFEKWWSPPAPGAGTGRPRAGAARPGKARRGRAPARRGTRGLRRPARGRLVAEMAEPTAAGLNLES